MKWTLWTAITSALVAIGLLASVAWIEPFDDLAAYEQLWRARDGLPATAGSLETLAFREDAVGWYARTWIARRRAAEGRFAEAEEALRLALALRPTDDLRRELALLLEAMGRREDALAEWETLLPLEAAVDAVLRLNEDPVRCATLLLSAGRPTDALDVLAFVDGQDAVLARARAWAALGRTADAVHAYETYCAARGSSAWIEIEYGRVLERMGAVDRALSAYERAGSLGASRRGALLEAQGRLDEAAEAYLRSSDPESRWQGAKLCERLGRQDQALEVYRSLAATTARVADDAALRVAVLDPAGPLTQGSPGIKWLAGQYLPPPRPPRMPSPPHSALRRSADALAKRAGFEWAEIELEFRLPEATPAEQRDVGLWYQEQGLYCQAFRIGVALGASEESPAWDLAYPLAWWSTVTRWATAYDVDPLLVLAIIREESNFLPTAVSSSDARGLMQLLPSTASWIATVKLGLVYDEQALFDPETNIRLGTWYIGYLLQRYEGDLALAVAAYNGGPGNIDRWTSNGELRGVNLPFAIESIETREYLTKVLSAWLAYRRFYLP